MKDKSKYLWIYSFVLLGVAIILIIAGSLSLGRVSMSRENNREVLNMAARESISSLSDENKNLQVLMEKIQKEKTQMENDIEALNEENNLLKKSIENSEKIMKAQELYDNRKYAQSAELIGSIDQDVELIQSFKQKYDELKNKLKKSGKLPN